MVVSAPLFLWFPNADCDSRANIEIYIRYPFGFRITSAVKFMPPSPVPDLRVSSHPQ